MVDSEEESASKIYGRCGKDKIKIYDNWITSVGFVGLQLDCE